MKKELLQARISLALEAELSEIYDQLGVSSGDISPWDSIEWDRLTEEMAILFQSLIDWNTNEE